MASSVSVQFLGAAQTVTGSRFLLTHQGKRVLVDCGLFQGLKDLRLQNWEPFPVDPRSIDAVILTHAHIDHSGYIPRLIKEGFSGRVYSTAGTKALAEILLPDTGYLQEEEAEYLNRRRISKHHPALPLFSMNEAQESLQRFEVRQFGDQFEPVPGFRCCFLYAGHILGAGTLVIHVGNKVIGFSGDVGRLHDHLFYPPAVLPALDFLVVESTYGDRLHPGTDPMSDLGAIIRKTAARYGVVLIPAFAVGRSQTMLFFLSRLRKSKKIPDIPIFLNSPMATHATEALEKFRTLHKLSDSECQELREGVRFVETVEESKALNEMKGPMIIISASGMATGGRILHHLKAFAPDPKNSIVLTGFQAAGTRGEAIARGAPEIKIHGQMIPVNAEVHNLENLSAHADAGELVTWLNRARLKPRQVFVVHGEASSSRAMASLLKEKMGWTCEVPEPLSVYQLE